MRWIWIDKFVEFTPQQSAKALKNVTAAEEQLYDLYPDFPIYPHSLIVEGMAQTAGILVGEARNFLEKVVLAKIGKAVFHRLVRPGDTLIFAATIRQLSETGAAIDGVVSIDSTPVADIELMFSHLDKNLAGTQFPEHNFIFTEQMTSMLRNVQGGAAFTL